MTKSRKPQIDLELDYIDKLKAIGMSDSTIPDVTFTFADYQCLERLMNVRDITVEDDLKKFLQKIHEKDNDEVCKNVAEIVIKQNKRFFEILDKQSESISAIEDSVKGINTAVNLIQADIESIKSQITAVEKKVSEEDLRILRLEEYVKPKWILVRVGVTIVIAVLMALLVHSWLAVPLHKIFIMP